MKGSAFPAGPALGSGDAGGALANALAWNPQPGHAAEAQRALEQTLDAPDFTQRERRAQRQCLPVHTAVTAGDVPRAGEAMANLDGETQRLDNVAHGDAQRRPGRTGARRRRPAGRRAGTACRADHAGAVWRVRTAAGSRRCARD